MRRRVADAAGACAQVRNTLLTCIVFCGPFFIAFCVNNTIAWAQGVRAPRLSLSSAASAADCVPPMLPHHLQAFCSSLSASLLLGYLPTPQQPSYCSLRVQSTAAFPFGTICIIAIIWYAHHVAALRASCAFLKWPEQTRMA